MSGRQTVQRYLAEIPILKLIDEVRILVLVVLVSHVHLRKNTPTHITNQHQQSTHALTPETRPAPTDKLQHTNQQHSHQLVPPNNVDEVQHPTHNPIS